MTESKLEPKLLRNRAAYDRLKDLQLVAAVATVVCALLVGALILVLEPPRWVQWLLVPVVVVGIGVGGALEVGKVVVFRRDLVERLALEDKDRA